MKYIPSDKLIAEIERRLSEIPTPKVGDSNSTENFYRRDELLCLKKFACSLQQDRQEADYKALLYSLLEAIDYSFVRSDGTYPVSLTYPVIDKVQYIKGQLSNEHEKVKQYEQVH